tara:strand:- start:605 stop:967 length:363 start_codon:yes stop_codon:yes gene_type:complete
MIITFINLFIALTLLNVWIFRFNNETKYRGGTAKSMKEEFLVYGLPLWFMYLTGTLKIILATLLIIGIWISSINLYCYFILSTLMLGAILMHIKVKDPIIKSLPAFSILTLLATLIGITF